MPCLVLLVTNWRRKINLRKAHARIFSLSAFLESLAHRRNVTSPSIFYRYQFSICSSEHDHHHKLVPLLYSRGRSTHYSDWFHELSVAISKYHKDVLVNSFFRRIVKLGNNFNVDSFPLTFILNVFKSRFNRHLLSIQLFHILFIIAIFFLL